MMAVTDILAHLQSVFNADEAEDLAVSFQFMITDDDDFYVTIDHGNCDAVIGKHDNADITMTMDVGTVQEVLTGELDGMQAFLSGRLQAEGNLMLGTRLGQLFDCS